MDNATLPPHKEITIPLTNTMSKFNEYIESEKELTIFIQKNKKQQLNHN